MITKNDLISDLKKLGLSQNDVVLVHSSFKSFGGVVGGPQTVIDAILELLGKEGTLIVPTFSWDFCNKIPFDVRHSPSKQGIISEMVRQNPISKRILHPIYSFSIIGKLSKKLSNLKYESSFGRDSLFGKLREINGKILLIGVKFIEANTFIHHVEEVIGTDYRFLKKFEGYVIDKNENKTWDYFYMNVKPLDGTVETNFDRIEKLCESNDITNSIKIGNSTVKLMNAKELFDFTYKEIQKDPHLLCNLHKKNSKKI
jgi:aminoglycoside 3-N-acetyltransferase